MGKTSLIVRADATVAMGVGHVMRCAALGQAWLDDGGMVTFATKQSTHAVDEYFRDQGFVKVSLPPDISAEEEIRMLAEIARDAASSCLVVDGYQFDSNYQRLIKLAGMKLMVMDDIRHCEHYHADLVLNQNITACESMYSQRDSHTKLLLGTSFAMLRREFRQFQTWQRNFTQDTQDVLVTIGGTDPDGLTPQVMESLATIDRDSLSVTVIVGGSNPRLLELRNAPMAFQSAMRVLRDVRDMASEMAKADVAIICGGGTLWEALYMGCAIITYSRPGIQEEIHAKLAADGTVIHLGLVEKFSSSDLNSALSSLLSSPQLRESMGRNGRTEVDGRGTERVLRAIKELIH